MRDYVYIAIINYTHMSFILVLDAEPVVRDVVTAILKHEGYTVSSTGDVIEALRMVKKAAPDLLVTNVNLPGMRGHDASQLLKEVCPNMRVMMVAGLPDEKRINEMTWGDQIEPFPKPFTAQEFAEKVKDVLSR